MWQVDLDDSPAPQLTNAPRAPKTHWRQAAQLFPNEQLHAVCPGEAVCVQVEPYEGRELRFQLKLQAPVASGATPPRNLRPHAGWFEARPPTESAHDVQSSVPPDARRATSGVAVRCSRDTRPHRSSGDVCARRSVELQSFRSRRPRAAVPSARVGADPRWLEEQEQSSKWVEQFALNPRSSLESMQTCDAALDIGAQPGMLGVDPMDAYQAVRLFYAN